MSVLPTNSAVTAAIAASAAGVKSTESEATTKSKRKSDSETTFQRALDETDVSVDAAQAADAVRNAKGNDQEESHEDRQEHGLLESGPDALGHLDIEG